MMSLHDFSQFLLALFLATSVSAQPSVYTGDIYLNNTSASYAVPTPLETQDSTHDGRQLGGIWTLVIVGVTVPIGLILLCCGCCYANTRRVAKLRVTRAQTLPSTSEAQGRVVQAEGTVNRDTELGVAEIEDEVTPPPYSLNPPAVAKP